MRRYSLLLISLLLLVTPLFGATYYVDGGCTNNGNGNGPDCAASAGATGAFNVMYSGNALVKTLTAGDTLDVRGAHAITTDHTSSANHLGGAAFDGWYFSKNIDIKFNCGSGCTIKVHGWTAPGTGEYVVMSGTRCPSAGSFSTCGSGTGWTQCAGVAGSCDAPCDGIDASIACNTVWYATDSGTAGSGFQSGSATELNNAVDATGAPAFMVATKAELDNAPGSFASTRCSTATWKPCATDYDCYPTGRNGTCSGSATVRQSFYDSANGRIFVHYGTSLPTRPYVFYNQFNIAFDTSSASVGITVQGFNILNRSNDAIFLHGGPLTFTDVTVFYVMKHLDGNGQSRAFNGDTTNVTVQDSEMAYTADEFFHLLAPSGSPGVYTIRRNYMHHMSGRDVMGVMSSGAPNVLNFGDDNATTATSDFTGTIVSDNIINNSYSVSGGSGSTALRFETGRGVIFRDNLVLNQTNANQCVSLGHAATTTAANATNNNEIYNNLFHGCANGGVEFYADTNGGAGTEDTSSNSIYNNTFIDAGTAGNNAIYVSTGTGTITNNLIRNNIFYSSGAVKQVNFTGTNSTNKFEYNLIKTTANPAATFPVGGVSTSKACSALSDLGAGNVNNCPDPLFVNTANNDYHIQAASPAKDVGTSTGLPTGRTRDINNTIATIRGFAPYNDNQSIANSVWDIGLDEISSGGTVTMTISKTDSPDPVVPGNNLTYTLAYQNTGGASATGVTIIDTIPTNTTFVSATGGGTSNGTTVTWNIGTVAAGASGTVQMVVGVVSPLADGTVISNSSYSISSNESSAVSGVADTTTVTSLPVLLLSMSDAPDPVLAGSNITYTIFYSNTGTAGATNVVITDAVPVNTTFVSATNSGSESGGTVTWNIGAVNAGSFASVQMVVTASAGLANGATVTNSTYTLASSELSTINGTPISTGVIAAITTIPQPKFPITSRQNGWTQTQTLLFDGAADVVQTPNTGQWIRGQASELLTLSTSGATTDTSANLLPANAIIEAVVARVTTTITTAANWKLGDAAQAARFTGAITDLTAGSTTVGLNHASPIVASADLGPVQTSAAKVRVTCNTTPGAGALRITVFYRQFVAPAN